MFDKDKFRGAVASAGSNFADISRALGISPATLYRKTVGKSDFSRNEMEIIRIKLGLTSEDVLRIFFAE